MKLRSTLSVLGLTALALPAFGQASVTQAANIGARIYKPLVITPGGNGNAVNPQDMEFATIALNTSGPGLTSAATITLTPAAATVRTVSVGTAFLIAAGGPVVAAGPQAPAFTVSGSKNRRVGISLASNAVVIKNTATLFVLTVNNFKGSWDGAPAFALTTVATNQFINNGTGTSTFFIGGDLVIPAGTVPTPVDDGDYTAAANGTSLSVTIAYN